MIRKMGLLISLIVSLFSASIFARPIIVHQIEVLGVENLPQEEIEAGIEILIGDELDANAIRRTSESIEQLYQRNGFSQVVVKSELVRRDQEGRSLNVVRISITEGAPTRVWDVDVVGRNLSTRDLEKVWKELQPGLASQAGIQRGSIFSQQVVDEAFQRIKADLESENFVDVKLVKIETNLVAQPETKDIPDEAQTITDRWVKLRFVIDVGDRVSFGFRGNKRFGQNELLAIVNDQRSVGFGRNYVEEIRERIERIYLSKGYANVSVTYRTFDKISEQKRHVTYFIVEGHRVEIQNILFDGNEVFSSEVLREKLFELAPLLMQRNYFVAEEVNSSAELLIDWIQSQGYLSAKLVTIDKRIHRNGRLADLSFFIYEGDQTIVEKVQLDGISSEERKEVMSILGIQEGKPLNLFAFSEGVENVKVYFKNRGFLEVVLANEDREDVVQYSLRNRRADIRLIFEKGPQFRVGRIFIDGLNKTNTWIAERELKFKVGDVLEQQLVVESEARLRKLGLFGVVKIQHRDQPGSPGFKDVRVLLSEGTPGLLAGGVGIRNDLGLRVFGSAGYSNIWHRNHALALTGTANRRFEDFCKARTRPDENFCFIEYRFRLGYTWPWFLLDEMDFRPSITQELKRFNQFDALSRIFTISFEKPLWDPINLVGFLTYNVDFVNQFNAEDEVDNQNLRIGAIIPSLSVDLRDNPLAPTKGFFARASYEIASTIFGSQSNPPIAYTKAQFRADQIFPLARRRIRLILSFRTGLERNLVDPLEFSDEDRRKIGIPLIKQFTLGGAASIRGFKEQELFSDKRIQGTLAYVNYRSQVDFPITGDIRFGPFFDAGNLFVDRYSLGGLRYGTGVGLRYETPVGPVNFEWGFKLDRQKGEEPHRFYFTIGIL